MVNLKKTETYGRTLAAGNRRKKRDLTSRGKKGHSPIFPKMRPRKRRRLKPRGDFCGEKKGGRPLDHRWKRELRGDKKTFMIEFSTRAEEG